MHRIVKLHIIETTAPIQEVNKLYSDKDHQTRVYI